jgi:DNA recombination protein RmuC
VGATDKTSRDTALKQHLTDIRNNVTRLSEAGYNRLPNRNTPDFVVMFVPNEPALFTALQNDSKLWQDAYKQNILLVGPTTLLSIIRIVNMLWVEERQMQNVKAVMERGAKLYDKFNGFINDMEDIGKNLAKAGESYDAAFSKLKTGQGSLIRQTEMMRKLGVPSKNRISSRFLEDAGIETAEEVEEDD